MAKMSKKVLQCQCGVHWQELVIGHGNFFGKLSDVWEPIVPIGEILMGALLSHSGENLLTHGGPPYPYGKPFNK